VFRETNGAAREKPDDDDGLGTRERILRSRAAEKKVCSARSSRLLTIARAPASFFFVLFREPSAEFMTANLHKSSTIKLQYGTDILFQFQRRLNFRRFSLTSVDQPQGEALKVVLPFLCYAVVRESLLSTT
jgi:hypothetical protein